MLNEPASSLDDDHPHNRRLATMPTEELLEPHPHYTEIREAISLVMTIHHEEFPLDANVPARHREDFVLIPRESQHLLTFRGQLIMNAETAYQRLDMLFATYDLLPIFRKENGQHVIHVLQGRVKPNTGGEWLSAVLFLATLFSVLFVGTQFAIAEIAAENPGQARQLINDLPMNLWRGWPYAVSILAILGAHELGHYFMTRKHRTAASLPYFLPFPFGLFGTLGAAIRLREPMRNRKVLLDVGAAGPLAGLVLAVPIVFIGLATSPVMPIGPGYQEGNSILYALAKMIVFGRFLPDGEVDVYVNQIAWAGWTGLLVTGLNLIPVGQLDGGHVLYSLLGKQARKLYYPFIGALLLLTVFIARELFVFVLLIMLLGNHHAVPLDDITPLDNRRRNTALFTLGIFFLVFVPSPLSATEPGLPSGDGRVIELSMLAVVGLMWAFTSRWHWRGQRLTKR